MIVDSDVIIRFLTNDDPIKAERFEKYLQTGQKLSLTDVTFAEIYWTLASFYQFPKDKILGSLEALINYKSIVCRKEVLAKTLKLIVRHNISLIDAYNCACALLESDSKILSYDRKLGKIGGLSRVEP